MQNIMYTKRIGYDFRVDKKDLLINIKKPTIAISIEILFTKPVPIKYVSGKRIAKK